MRINIDPVTRLLRPHIKMLATCKTAASVVNSSQAHLTGYLNISHPADYLKGIDPLLHVVLLALLDSHIDLNACFQFRLFQRHFPRWAFPREGDGRLT